MRSIVVILESPLPYWERAHSFLSENQAEFVATWLTKNGVKAINCTFDEYTQQGVVKDDVGSGTDPEGV